MDQPSAVTCPHPYKATSENGVDHCPGCTHLGACFRYPETPSICLKLAAWQEELVDTDAYKGVGPCFSCPHTVSCVGAEISIMTDIVLEFEEDLENLTPILRRSHS